MCRSDLLTALHEVVQLSLQNGRDCYAEEKEDRVVVYCRVLGKLKILEFLSNGRILEDGQPAAYHQLTALLRLRVNATI
jgi:hypothetical protein